MGKPTALGLVREMLQQTYIVDVVKGPNGLLIVDAAMDSPAPLRPGKRYRMLEDAEYRMLLSRVAAAEASMQLTRLMRKSGRHSTKRTK